MALKEYRRKRHFDRTPEPAGRVGASRKKPGLLFVIQKHDASRLHYDFRLELGGVLKSWAVPKGPSLDPGSRVLAVEVDDHPIEYGSFEGTIPQGEYGGGTVMLWDRGTWEPIGDPGAGYKKGHLKFVLHGEKLRGGWALIRMRRGDREKRNNWLLIKEKDDFARAASGFSVTENLPDSVASGRTMEEIGAAKGKVWTSNRASSNGRARKNPVAGGHDRKTAPDTDAEKATSQRVARRRSVRAAVDPGSLPGARKVRQPGFLGPQLATLVKEVPAGDEYIHEAKLDGYRILAVVRSGVAAPRRNVAGDGRVCRLFTRRGNDWTGHFPGISAKVLEMPIESGILDGELVVLNKDGISSFQALQNKMKSGAEAPLLYYVFDIPHFGGYDLTRVPLLDRKRLLRSIVADDEKGSIRYSDHIEGRGKEVFANACRLHLEGVVSKLKNSRYESRRSKSWLKVKCQRGQEFVIGGWTEPSGAREHFGALLLGYYKEAGGLVYCGKVGTGFTGTSLAEIYAHLKKLERRSASFINPPRGSEARGVHWLEPKLVAEVAFTEWTTDGNVRHPSFQGLREDKDAREVVREMAEDERGSNGAAARRGSGTADTGPRAETTMPASSKRRASGRAASSNGSGGMVSKDRAAHPGETRKKAGAALRPSGAPSRPSTDSADSTMIAGVRLSNPDRVLYPEVGLTKLDVARYYESVAEFVLPHVIHRPLSLVRCPRGWDQKCFFQKHLPEDLPPGVRGIPIKEKTSTDTYIVIDDLSGLISLVQMGVLEIHPWGSREDRIEQPDRLTFDFDPGTDVGWRGVVRGAQLCRDLLSKAGLRSWVKTSGGKGLHVVVPLMRSTGWEDAKDFAHAVADEMVRREPTLYTANMSKAKRSGKIFVDYLRNGRGATSVAAYSTRARSGAPVSTPLGWDELEGDIGATSFSIGNVPQRLKRLKKDPWDATGFGGVKQSITGSALRALRR